MSRLTFTGNEIKSTGEYLPAPYINKITVSETDVSIENFIFINDILENYVISAGEVVNSQDVYDSEVLGLHYYIFLVGGRPENEYESIIKGDLNPLFYYYNNSDYDPASFGKFLLLEIAANTSAMEEFTDNAGNLINAFSINTNIDSSNDSTVADFWDSDGNLSQVDYVFCFASSFNYFSNSEQLSSDTFNQRLFDLYVGDVSYERIYDSDGNLALGERVVFVDSEQNFYDEVPLQSIDYTVHKIDTIDHEYIKENIEELLSEYSDLYNSETGNTELKNVMNSIYTTLETSYEDYDILNKLESVRRSFPNKTPSNNVGKLYKRFSRRMYNINNTVKEVEQVFKEIKYNSKIIDLRTITTGDASPSYDSDLLDDEFIYTDWKAVNLDLGQEGYSTIFGYFFVDYEKALIKRSAASNFLDMRKLQNFGLSVPYNKFKLSEMDVYKVSTESTLKSRFNNDNYPKTTSMTYESEYTIQPDSVMKDLLTITPYGANDGSNTTPENGYATHAINRKYTPIYDTESGIQDYRLILFELLEYVIGEDTEDDEYQVTTTFEDETVDIIVDLKNFATGALQQMQDYYTEAQETCVFSTDLGRFNQFFVDGILSTYQEEPQSAPWYTAPITYIMQLDLYYNLYNGDLQEIEDAVKKLVNKINPVNGTLEEISVFISELQSFIDNTYESTDDDELKEYLQNAAGDPASFSVSLAIPPLTDLNIEEEEEESTGGVTEPDDDGIDVELPTGLGGTSGPAEGFGEDGLSDLSDTETPLG